MSRLLSDEEMDLLFREARSYNSWTGQPVSDEILQAVYELAKWGPTSFNCGPARILFLKSTEAKEKLYPCLWDANVPKAKTAPVIAIIGYDSRFYDKLPDLFPAMDVRPLFADNPAYAAETALRNGSLQGAYFIIAARALGLDCGPMSGFYNDKVDSAFFPDGQIKSNFLCCLGHGDESTLYPRGPRLDFDTACRIE